MVEKWEREMEMGKNNEKGKKLSFFGQNVYFFFGIVHK